MSDPGMTGRRLPHGVDVLWVPDPDLQPAAFCVCLKRVGRFKRPDSTLGGHWMGRDRMPTPPEMAITFT